MFIINHTSAISIIRKLSQRKIYSLSNPDKIGKVKETTCKMIIQDSSQPEIIGSSTILAGISTALFNAGTGIYRTYLENLEKKLQQSILQVVQELTEKVNLVNQFVLRVVILKKVVC